jgi:sec-independent protein translocase protein TatB
MLGVGFGELVLIVIVALVVLGPEKLPEVAKQLGKGLRELKRASSDLQNSFHEAVYAEEIKELRERYRPPTAVPPPGTAPREVVSPEAMARAIASAATGVGPSLTAGLAAAAAETAAAVNDAVTPAVAPAPPAVPQATPADAPATTVGATLASEPPAAPGPIAPAPAPRRETPT